MSPSDAAAYHLRWGPLLREGQSLFTWSSPYNPRRLAIAAGTRFGPYEILSALGAGGMGEVYRARDTNLNRDVALKTLPESFVSDPERVARFRREAQVLASLNHPNIGAIYGFEDAPNPSTPGHPMHALVLELV